MVLAESHQQAHWCCSHCKHIWTAMPNTKVQTNSGCPKCSQHRGPNTRHPTFAECQHPLLTEWNHDHNAAQGLFPNNVTLRSNKQVHWSCKKCPLGEQHLWTAAPHSRLAKKPQGCPFCARKSACKCNSLQTHFPAIASEWHHDKNVGTPQDYTFSSNRKVWWHNAERGSWQQTINARTNGIAQHTASRKYVDGQS